MTASPDDPVLDAARASALVEAACPELHPVNATHFGRGWDNDVYLVNDAWVFRFPRNEPAATALGFEEANLGWLAPRLPTPIPVMGKSGRMENGWPFAGYPMLPARTIHDQRLDADSRAKLAPAVAGFLRALHAIRPDDLPMRLSFDTLGRYDVARRGPPTSERLKAWWRDRVLPTAVAQRLLDFLDDPPDSLPDEPMVIVHADMHPRNLLVDDAGRLSGVIDWVDLHEGYPATDLIALYEVVPPEARDTFLTHYGPASEKLRRWARWRAINHSVGAFAGAIERGDEVFARGVHGALVEMAV